MKRVINFCSKEKSRQMYFSEIEYYNRLETAFPKPVLNYKLIELQPERSLELYVTIELSDCVYRIVGISTPIERQPTQRSASSKR